MDARFSEMSDARPARVLVIGGGFLGSNIAAGLIGQGISTVVVSRSEPVGSARRLLAGAELVIEDASDPGILTTVMDDVDHVISCIGGLMPAESNRDPALDVTISLPPLINVLEALRGQRVPLTYLSSGGAVYGNTSRLPVPETAPTEPISSYGIMKLAGEKYVSMYADLYGIPARILRCSNVYGEGQRPDRSQGAVAAFMHRIGAGQPITIWGDGSVVRDYIHVSDVVRAVIDLLSVGGPRILNVGSGVGTSLNELITIIASTLGAKTQIDRRPGRPFDVQAIVLDVSRITSLVCFTPVPLAAGIHKTWQTAPGRERALAASG